MCLLRENIHCSERRRLCLQAILRSRTEILLFLDLLPEDREGTGIESRPPGEDHPGDQGRPDEQGDLRAAGRGFCEGGLLAKEDQGREGGLCLTGRRLNDALKQKGEL